MGIETTKLRLSALDRKYNKNKMTSFALFTGPSLQYYICVKFTLTFPRIVCCENWGQMEREEDKCEQVQIMFQIWDYKGSVTDQYGDSRANIRISNFIETFHQNKHRENIFLFCKIFSKGFKFNFYNRFSLILT